MRLLLTAGVAVVALSSCGGASVTAAQLEREVPGVYNRDGSSLRHVTCARREKNVFRCVGEFHASRRAAERAVGSIDTSDWSARDWRVMQERESGPVTLDVTVNSDGRWVATPVS